MGGFEGFRDGLLDAVRPHAKELLAYARLLRSEVDRRDNEGIPEQPPLAKEPSRDLLLLYRITNAYREVSDSFENLTNIEVYLRRFPFAETHVSRAGYIRYHVENYFQELYILEQRSQALLRLLRRAYRKQAYRAVFNEAFDLIDELVNTSFTGVVCIRGAHVHEARFEDSDLRVLSLLHLLSDDDKEFSGRYREVFKDVRARKVRWIKGNNQEVKRLLDAYFAVLKALLFDKNGNFKFPTAPKTS